MIYLLTNEKGEFITTEKNEFIIIKKEDTNMNKVLRNLKCEVGQYMGSKMGKCNLKTIGIIDGIGLVQSGTDLSGIDKKATFDKLVKEGKLYPYMGVFNFEPTTGENTVITSPSGKKSRGKDAFIEYNFMFDDGICVNRSLRDKLNGDWDLILFTNLGVVLTATEAKVLGFKVQYTDARFALMNAEGTEAEQTTFSVQLAYPEQWNDRMEILLYENTDYTLPEIEGAEGVAIFAEEVKAGTELTIEVTNVCNHASKVTGLQEKTNFKVNGVEPATVTQNLSKPGTYTLTVTDALVVNENATVEVQGVDEQGNMYVGYKVFEVTA